MEGVIKPELTSASLKQQLIIFFFSSPIIRLVFFLCPFIFLLDPLFFFSFFSSYFPSPALSPLPTRPSFHPFPPIHSCCLGNNTKRFSSQLCHRGNAWLSSRPLLEARRPPVRSSRCVLTAVRARSSVV